MSRPSDMVAGDVVTVEFPGARGTKRRPAVIVSSAAYHATRPDVLLGLVTSHVEVATTPSDYVIEDWAAAGLRKPSAFRVYLWTEEAECVTGIGHLSDRDWREVQRRLRVALDLGKESGAAWEDSPPGKNGIP